MPRNISEEKLQAKTYMILWWELEMFRFSFIKLKNRGTADQLEPGSKNSGGEGFLSAFVILSSLLDYMRKDDSDIFMDKNEGKVLLMDNPFAQTNAEHLLKPLMNLADKTNTQLICLTGLGGESIYNRFDNIYVLNLIEAHLRNGIQYLRPEHKKEKK